LFRQTINNERPQRKLGFFYVHTFLPGIIQGSIKLETPVSQVFLFQFYIIKNWSVNSGNKNKFCFIKLIVVYLIIHLTPNKNFMKEMFKELYKVHKEEPRELWEGVVLLITIFGLFGFLLIIFH